MLLTWLTDIVVQGMTGPRKLGKTQLEGSFHSHQVPLPLAFKDDEQFELLVKWLKSYNIDELIDVNTVHSKDAWFVKESALQIVPKALNRRPGMLKVSIVL